MYNINKKGLIITGYGIAVSMAMSFCTVKYTPDMSDVVCKYTTPIAQFEDEKQFAISVSNHYTCIDSVKLNQYFLLTFAYFMVYIQVLRCLIMASYLFSKYEPKKDELYSETQTLQEICDSFVEEFYRNKRYKFQDLESLKASKYARERADHIFQSEIEKRNRMNND
jgi:hypothetical protein